MKHERDAGYDEEARDPALDAAFDLLMRSAQAPPDFHATVLARVAHRRVRRGVFAWVQSLALPTPALVLTGLLLVSVAGNGWLGWHYHAFQTTEERAVRSGPQVLTPGDADEATLAMQEGEQYAAGGDYEHAWPSYQRALALYTEAGDLAQQGHVLLAMGRARAALGQLSEALPLYQQALDVYQALGDQESRGQIWAQRGAVYAQLGQTAAALRDYEAALRATGTPIAQLLRATALLYDTMGDRAPAIRDMQQAARLGDVEAHNTLRAWGVSP